jgi:chorismate-pyruvate lyase
MRASNSQACALPAELDDLGLSLFQRMLLITDGAVTPLLEMYAGERIEAVKLSQVVEKGHCGSSIDRTLVRRVLLRGGVSRVNLLYAETTVFLDRIDGRILQGLLETNTPIGRLLLDARTETFREVLKCGSEPAGARARYFHVPEHSPMIFRTSRIWSAGALVMIITERFPETQFRGAWPPCA